MGTNVVIVSGELAYDPVIRESAKGMTATFVIPTDEFFTDSNTGNQTKRTEWHRLVAFNKHARTIAAYVRKGSTVVVQGSNRTEKWKDKDTGVEMSRTQVMVRSLERVGSAVNEGLHNT